MIGWPPESPEKPSKPNDGYQWDVFFDDQAARPLIYHGASSIFEPSIRRYGFAFDQRPYKDFDLDRCISILSQIEGSRAITIGRAVIDTYTKGTERISGFCFTFDYVFAMRFALMYRGGVNGG